MVHAHRSIGNVQLCQMNWTTHRFGSQRRQRVYLGLAVDEAEHLLSGQLRLVVVLDVRGGCAHACRTERQRKEHPVSMTRAAD